MASVTEQIVEILVDKFTAGEELAPDSAFEDLGLDSLVLVELAVILKRRFGVVIDENELAEAGTPEAVALLVETRGVAA